MSILVASCRAPASLRLPLVELASQQRMPCRRDGSGIQKQGCRQRRADVDAPQIVGLTSRLQAAHRTVQPAKQATRQPPPDGRRQSEPGDRRREQFQAVNQPELLPASALQRPTGQESPVQQHPLPLRCHPDANTHSRCALRLAHINLWNARSYRSHGVLAFAVRCAYQEAADAAVQNSRPAAARLSSPDNESAVGAASHV